MEENAAATTIEIIKDSGIINGIAIALIVPFISALILGLIAVFTTKPKKKDEDPVKSTSFLVQEKFVAVIGVGSIFISWVSIVITAFNAFSSHKVSSEKAVLWTYSFFGYGGTRVHDLEFGVFVDSLALFMGLIVATLALIIHWYATEYMRGDTGYARFFAKFNMFTGVMLSLVFSVSFLQAFIFWELVGLTSYLLIGFWYFKPSAAHAAKKAFLYNKIGDVSLLVGFIILYKYAGTLTYAQLPAAIAEIPSGSLALIGVLIFGGAVGKSAQFPLYTWLPDAMEGPTPVSAILHSSTMVKAGIYLIARSFFLYYNAHGGHFAFHEGSKIVELAPTVIAWIGVITAFLAAVQALIENDIKRILAYSTVSQIGYMAVGLGTGGLAPGMYHLLSHATFKATLFLTAGAVIHAVHSQNIWDMGGLANKIKYTFWPMVIAAAALAGLPPMSGFWSKDAVLLSAYSSDVPGHMAIFWLGTITAGITAFYSLRFILIVFFGEPRYDTEHVHPHDAGFPMSSALVILGVIIVTESLVFIPTPWFKFEDLLFEYLSPGVKPHEPEIMVMLASTLAVLIGLGLSYFVYKDGKPVELKSGFLLGLYNFIANRYYIDKVLYWIANKPVMLVGDALKWVDYKIIDRIIIDTVFARGALYFAYISDYFDQGFIDLIVNLFADMAKSLGRWFRKIQSGVISNYATIMVGALTLFLISVNIALYMGALA